MYVVVECSTLVIGMLWGAVGLSSCGGDPLVEFRLRVRLGFGGRQANSALLCTNTLHEC